MKHVLLLLAGIAFSIQAAPVRIVCLGDSITRGMRSGVSRNQTFEVQFAKWLQSQSVEAEVINKGIGGERTDQALKRLQKDVLSLNPEFVVVMYGTNDSAVDVGKSKSRLPLATYTANLHDLVRQIRAAKAKPVLMTSIPLCTSFVYCKRSPYREKGPNHRLLDYVHSVRNVAAEENVPLVDNFAAWSEAALMGQDLNALTTDGCHPNSAGHLLISATMKPVLAPLLGLENIPVAQRLPFPVVKKVKAPVAKPSANGNFALGCKFTETCPNLHGYSGLTDGNRTSDSRPRVYASGKSDTYPKLTTIDLGTPQNVGRIVICNSKDGSTRKVTVSLSTDGKEFKEVGNREFAKQDAAEWNLTFSPRPVRFVRISFDDSWLNPTHGSPHYMFLREVEVFAK